MDTDEAFYLQRDDKESKRSSSVGVLANFLRYVRSMKRMFSTCLQAGICAVRDLDMQIFSDPSLFLRMCQACLSLWMNLLAIPISPNL